MSRATILLRSDMDRDQAHHWVDIAPLGCSIEFKRSRRTLDQNALLWARLTEVSQRIEWYGQKLLPADWKDMFTASLRKARVVPGLDPGSFVVVGLHTSDMTKDEMGQLLDLIDAFAAQHGVEFKEREAA
jgi:hypothetical protein